ncbi:menaquinone biosynthetic enzyme MqnA/MqnD family protein [Salidesulfovibrio brasiliensis]|uniref:menaquinone biosynthetic enzyme MqnA/MqnD family protein n=1 Tax=Salidesulfovibrio brasiliensis TaxID=221711 RepID=UPI0006CFEA52|nr:menaquinone biosynthesis protein [Salidesulfovibrio brasiliensis]
MTVRLGKIGYLNVLPIYHPIESGRFEGDFHIVSGPPAELNRLMADGRLDVSATSSIEYARHPERYWLVPNLAIGSCGPVQSVLLLSRVPVNELDGRDILVSSQTHTSAALLKVLFRHWGITPTYTTGDATSTLSRGDRPQAILAIGDEALNLRYHPDYPVRVDLGEAWRDQTGLPFIFGVWVAQRSDFAARPGAVTKACHLLQQAKAHGREHIEEMCHIACENSCLDTDEMRSYFDGLVYDLGEAEQDGLKRFYAELVEAGLITSAPPLNFLPTGAL